MSMLLYFVSLLVFLFSIVHVSCNVSKPTSRSIHSIKNLDYAYSPLSTSTHSADRVHDADPSKSKELLALFDSSWMVQM